MTGSVVSEGRRGCGERLQAVKVHLRLRDVSAARESLLVFAEALHNWFVTDVPCTHEPPRPRGAAACRLVIDEEAW